METAWCFTVRSSGSTIRFDVNASLDRSELALRFSASVFQFKQWHLIRRRFVLFQDPVTVYMRILLYRDPVLRLPQNWKRCVILNRIPHLFLRRRDPGLCCDISGRHSDSLRRKEMQWSLIRNKNVERPFGCRKRHGSFYDRIVQDENRPGDQKRNGLSDGRIAPKSKRSTSKWFFYPLIHVWWPSSIRTRGRHGVVSVGDAIDIMKPKITKSGHSPPSTATIR